MKKELKDYLHLYLGCEMYSVPQQGEYFIEQLTGVDTDCIRVEGNVEHPPYYFKPILRPLSDITKEEKIELFKKVSLFDLSNCDFEFGDNYVNAIIRGIVIDAISFVGDNVEMMNNNGSFFAINPIAPVFYFYLSKHFDLFGLIPAGLAIDKTTLNK